MKEFIKILALVAIISFSSCQKNKKNETSMNFGEAHPNQIVEKTLVLNFNDESKADSNSFVEFSYLNEDGSLPNNIVYTINGENITGNKLKFYAYTFQNKNSEVKIGIKFPKGTQEKEYIGKFVLTAASPDLQQNISQGTNKIKSSVGETLGKWNVIYTDPIPLWIKITAGISSILLAIVLLFYILRRPNMPLGPKTFQRGMLSFLDGNTTSVSLENLQKYDISNTLGIEEGLLLEPFDKLYQKKKQRFARLKNNSSSLDIKVIYNGIEEAVGVNQELYNLDDIIIKTIDNKIYTLSYSNNKIKRF
jgi:hypothetical protein